MTSVRAPKTTAAAPTVALAVVAGAGHETRQKLLSAADTLLGQRSYGGVSVDDICGAAGVRKGSFYHFFDSKEALVLALFEQHWQQKAPQLSEIFAPNKTAAQQLAGLVQRIIDWQEEEYVRCGRVAGCAWYTIAQEMCAQNEGIGAKTEAIFQRYRDLHRSLLATAQKEGLLPADTALGPLAAAMWACCMGVLGQARLQNDMAVIRTTLPGVMARFLTPPDPRFADICVSGKAPKKPAKAPSKTATKTATKSTSKNNQAA